jgi:UDP-N-acetylmuramyl pentapeptide phosphotransferase/UDP-N-acetylglucosamine-1-phosphate transferase
MDWTLIIVFISSFLASYIVLPPLIRKLGKAGIVGADINKKGKPMVAEMG